MLRRRSSSMRSSIMNKIGKVSKISVFVFLFIIFIFLFSVKSTFAAYGDYSSTRPAWLDQSLTSANGDFTIWYVDEDRHSGPFVGDPDTDGDSLPDTWENNFFGNLNQTQNGNPDADNYTNLQEFQGGSWPDDDYFRPLDTIDPALNALGDNRIVSDSIDTLLFCQGRYVAWGFNAPALLPLEIFLRYTPYAGWGSVDPLWISPDIASDLTNPDRRWVGIHELFHNVQAAYTDVPRDTKWFIEGSARMSQDFFYNDMDNSPATNYAGEVRGFLGGPESVGLFERSYRGVFFWKYFCEQIGKSITGQPQEGFDALHRFMVSSNGLEGVDSLQQSLNDLDDGDYWKNRKASHFFATWATALYTRQFDPDSMSTLYYYRDEQENLPDSLERPVEITNAPYNAASNSYTPEAIPLNGSVVYNDIDLTTWTQNLGKWRSRYYAFSPDTNARFIIVWVDGKTNQRNYYASVSVRGDRVRDLYFNYGEDLLKAFYNDGLDEVGVVIAALDADADYDLIVWSISDFGINIIYPRTDNQEVVRIPEVGGTSTFEVHVKVMAEKPAGVGGDIYVDGLSHELFEVWVDDIPVDVISGHQIIDEYWLACVAPDLDPGEYDLRVRLINEQDIEIKSIRYADKPHIDRMIVIDRSGSMGSELMGNNEKMLAAKSGGRLYTDLMTDGDKLGLVSFGGTLDGVQNDSTLHKSLADVTTTYKNQVKEAINKDIPDDPSQYEHTAMGQGIMTGYDQLFSHGDSEHDWRIALLTDGIEDVEPYWDDATVSGVVNPSKVMIDAIALGSGAHETLLRRIAEETEGEYFHVPVSTTTSRRRGVAPGVDPVVENKVANVYRMINEREMGYARIWSDEGVVGDSGKYIYFTVYEGMRNLILTVNHPFAFELDVTVFNPDGASISLSIKDPTHMIYKIPVLPGTWTLRLGPSKDVPYLAILTGHGELTGKLFFTQPDNSAKKGAVEKICLALYKKSGPVHGSEVEATVTTPAGDVSKWKLYDDGEHGDGVAGDGIYSRDYRLTRRHGSYHVKVIAQGEDEKRAYRLEKNGFFLMEDDYDKDEDGMPHAWELRYGLDPAKNDSKFDKDNDGVPNVEEFYKGGDPSSDDTDNGGTQDGSELANGMNMLDFSDDLIAPPSALITNKQPTDFYEPDYQAPGSGENLLYWSLGRNYFSVDIYRSDTKNGTYSMIASGVLATKRPYADKGLINWKPYYYKIAAVTKTGIRTRLSDPVKGMPKPDNLAPWGGVEIEGSDTVVNVKVTLKLWASPDTKYVMLSNTGSFEGSAWAPFSETQSWTIAGFEGANFVYIQFMDSSGNLSIPFFDSVFYERDKDKDFLGDLWEIKFFGNLLQRATDDPDKDGLINIDEFKIGTFPKNTDSDGDGLSDGTEVLKGLNPLLNDSDISLPMNFSKGWSMVSLPVIPDDASVSSIFPDAVVVYGFEKGSCLRF
jgi:hypothetical protein